MQLPAPEEYIKPRRIFVTNYGWHDYSALQKIGDVFAVTQRDVDLRHTDRLRARIVEALEPMLEDDWLCLSGSPVIIAECVAVVMAKFGRLQYLYWEPLLRNYLERVTYGKTSGE